MHGLPDIQLLLSISECCVGEHGDTPTTRTLVGPQAEAYPHMAMQAQQITQG